MTGCVKGEQFVVSFLLPILNSKFPNLLAGDVLHYVPLEVVAALAVCLSNEHDPT